MMRSAPAILIALLLTPATGLRADEADEIVAAVAAGSDGAPVRAASVPPEQLVPAIVRAIDGLPPRPADPRIVTTDSVKNLRVRGLLFDLEKRTSKSDLDKLLLDAWPLATKDHTRAELLYKYGERLIRAAEPTVLAAFTDKAAAKIVRGNAATSLAALDWPKHRAAVLPALDADDTFAPMTVELVLYDKRGVDPAIVTLAARRIEAVAANVDRVIDAAMLAGLVGRYTEEANGVKGSARAALPKPADLKEEAARELKFFRAWWNANRQKFEPAAKAELEKLKAEAAK